MRIIALLIAATTITVVVLTVAFGIGQHPAHAVPQGNAHHVASYHGLPLCGEVDDDCYLPASLSELPHHVPAVILNGTVYTVSPTLN